MNRTNCDTCGHDRSPSTCGKANCPWRTDVNSLSGIHTTTCQLCAGQFLYPDSVQCDRPNCPFTKKYGRDFLSHLDDIAAEDAAGLKKAAESYGDSWKKRGGVGAYMMLARKWDRLQLRVENDDEIQYDIFEHIRLDTRSEGVIDDIRDLRRYLMLVEAEMRVRGAEAARGKHRDNA